MLNFHEGQRTTDPQEPPRGVLKSPLCSNHGQSLHQNQTNPPIGPAPHAKIATLTCRGKSLPKYY